MKKITQLISVIILLVTISCGHKKEEQNKTSPTEKQPHESVDILQLNNGNLWNANSETTQGIENMVLLLNNFSEKENIDAYTTLKQNLEKEFGSILTQCTMTGESHNQLHLFLVPMKDLFNGLSASDEITRKENLHKLKKHLAVYSTYFE